MTVSTATSADGTGKLPREPSTESAGTKNRPSGARSATRAPNRSAVGLPSHSASPPASSSGRARGAGGVGSGAAGRRSTVGPTVGWGSGVARGGASAADAPFIAWTSSAVASASARARCSGASAPRSTVDSRRAPAIVTAMRAADSSQPIVMRSGSAATGPRSRIRTSISSFTPAARPGTIASGQPAFSTRRPDDAAVSARAPAA